MKGSYILVIELKENKTLQIGKLGKIFFKKGFYLYVGSALNGLEKRVQRHLKKDKKIHWHIDYLLRYAKIISVYYQESNKKEECIIAKKLANKLSSIPGFGCSDCKCDSHLFYNSNIMISIVSKMNLEKYLNAKP
jgi:Uri superfamily endonuclease